MSRSVLLSCVLAGTLVAAGLPFIAGQASAAAGPDVTVTNVPLPVQVVNPANSPSSVNIGNVTDLAKAFGVQQPVAFSLDGNSKDPAVHKYTVPLGRRLVIEYVSGTCLANGSVNGLPPFMMTCRFQRSREASPTCTGCKGRSIPSPTMAV